MYFYGPSFQALNHCLGQFSHRHFETHLLKTEIEKKKWHLETCLGDFYSKTNNYLGGLFVKLPYICWQLSSNFRLENTVEKAPQPRFAQKACTPKVQLVSTVWPPGVKSFCGKLQLVLRNILDLIIFAVSSNRLPSENGIQLLHS